VQAARLMSKETYYSVKRDLWHRPHEHGAVQAARLAARTNKWTDITDIADTQKRPIGVSKETYWADKRTDITDIADMYSDERKNKEKAPSSRDVRLFFLFLASDVGLLDVSRDVRLFFLFLAFMGGMCVCCVRVRVCVCVCVCVYEVDVCLYVVYVVCVCMWCVCVSMWAYRV
jgi:hypothetical protein